MTRSHAFAMGYKIVYHELDETEFDIEDVPALDDAHRHHFINGKRLAGQHLKQYKEQLTYYEHIDKA